MNNKKEYLAPHTSSQELTPTTLLMTSTTMSVDSSREITDESQILGKRRGHTLFDEPSTTEEGDGTTNPWLW